MHTIYILSLHFTLALLTRAAPLPVCSGKTGLLMANSDFQKLVKNTSSLVNKILGDIPGVHKSCVSSEAFSLDSSNENLQYMETVLGIPRPPILKELSADFTMDLCLNNMRKGLLLYQDLLSTIRQRVASSDKVNELHANVRDLLVLVNKMRDLSQLDEGEQYGGSGLAARLTGEYEVQVASHLVLHDLRSFARDLYRSLRNIDQTKC
ncbi:hypothetical protein GJAV_G00226380 [Gymnothorax javanicus]|nr:hypothetical protein GJAV_G00226380 [Gymnothorax javanicus]